MLCKLEWSWELRTWSHKMNMLDILSTSPHYFYWEWIGTTSDNSNFDLRGLNSLTGWFFLSVMPWTWCEHWWYRIYLRSLNLFPVFPDLLLKNCWCFYEKAGLPKISVLIQAKMILFYKKKQGMNQLSHPSKAGHPSYQLGWAVSPFPFNPNSDQHQSSPNNIHTLSRDKVVIINKMIT